MIGTLLAEIPDSVVTQIEQIHQRVVPDWSLRLMWCLTIMTAVLVVMIYLRQKKIAQNQVDLAKLIERLIEKE